jgi:predicted kinase
MKIYILSGASGSGKSTLADLLAGNDGVVISADLFFMKDKECINDDGVMTIIQEYKFDPTQLGEAHAQCLRKYVQHIWGYTEGIGNIPDVLVVDNTNISPEELAPYVALANAFNIEYEIRTIICDPDIAAKRNVHGVPERTVRSMCDRLKNRKLPFYWKENVMLSGEKS